MKKDRVSVRYTHTSSSMPTGFNDIVKVYQPYEERPYYYLLWGKNNSFKVGTGSNYGAYQINAEHIVIAFQGQETKTWYLDYRGNFTNSGFLPGVKYDEHIEYSTLKIDGFKDKFGLVDVPGYKPLKEDIPNFAWDGHGIRIANYKPGMKVVPYDKTGGKYINVTIYGKTRGNPIEVLYPKFYVQQKFINNLKFNIGGVDITTFETLGFEFMNNSFNEDVINADYSFKSVFRVPYPTDKPFSMDYISVSSLLYSSSWYDDIENNSRELRTFSHSVENLTFWKPEVDKEEDLEEEPKEEIKPPLTEPEEGEVAPDDEEVEKPNPDNPSPPISPDPDNPGSGFPEFPQLPDEAPGFFDFIKFIIDGIIFFFKVIIWVVTAPLKFLLDSFKTLTKYITSSLDILGNITSQMTDVFAFIPKDILNVIWGALSTMLSVAIIRFIIGMVRK